MLLLPPPVPIQRSGEPAGGICLSVFPKGHLRVARPVQLTRSPPPPCAPALLGSAVGADQSQRQKYLSIYTELAQGSALAPPSSTLTQRDVPWDIPQGSFMKHQQAFPTKCSSPEQLVSVPAQPQPPAARKPVLC